MSKITVVKLNIERQETWRYTGTVVDKGQHFVRLEALFNRADILFHGILLKEGDRFVETFYSDRWYNIFEMYDRDDDTVKGWYCNIGYPAEIKDDCLSYVDLALDLLVYPNGKQLVLDEDEFDALPLTHEDQKKAEEALAEVKSVFKNKTY
jgi:uncharacterized protein